MASLGTSEITPLALLCQYARGTVLAVASSQDADIGADFGTGRGCEIQCFQGHRHLVVLVGFAHFRPPGG